MTTDERQVELKRRGFRVVGRVQGVGFRWWTRATASGLGVTGWVRNEADGSVVVQAVGSESALARLSEALHEGPSVSRVDRVEEIPPTGGPTEVGFRIEA